ncbi:MAG TPA: hypothetical protein VMU59_08190 [Caulobacteraceae bacterium]|nr:hypothetical protein [Caulobacteraceae bacterium]
MLKLSLICAAIAVLAGFLGTMHYVDSELMGEVFLAFEVLFLLFVGLAAGARKTSA